MKAFTVYPKDEINLRRLLDKLRHCGQINCSFQEFAQIYGEWHTKTFPGCPINTTTANFRDDWFTDFVNYIANRDVEGKVVVYGEGRYPEPNCTGHEKSISARKLIPALWKALTGGWTHG